MVADSIDIFFEKIMSWRDCLECGELEINLNKSKMKMSDGNHGFVEKCGRWSCSDSGKVLGGNSIQCTKYLNWIHKKMFWREKHNESSKKVVLFVRCAVEEAE